VPVPFEKAAHKHQKRRLVAGEGIERRPDEDRGSYCQYGNRVAFDAGAGQTGIERDFRRAFRGGYRASLVGFRLSIWDGASYIKY
jgi:hypothetical protein